MATYSDMRARIADELANDGDITSAQINYAIQDTIKVYERRSWWFNTNVGTFTTVANQEYYTATDWPAITDAVQIDAMTVTYNGVKTSVMPVDFDSIDEIQTNYAISIPRNYAYYDQSIRMYPIPSGAYTITVAYVMRLTTLSADSDTNAWTTEAEELIRQGAKRRIALNYLSSEEVAARYAGLEREAYTMMLAEQRSRQPNTLLRTSTVMSPKRFNIISG